MTKSLRGEKTNIDGVQKTIWSNISSSTTTTYSEAKNVFRATPDSCPSLNNNDEHG